MPKGRRKGGLSGVSKFMHAINTHSIETAKGPEPVQKTGETPEAQSGSVAKRRKTDTTDTAAVGEMEPSWIKKYDETGLVPHYTHLDQVPPHLQKC